MADGRFNPETHCTGECCQLELFRNKEHVLHHIKKRIPTKITHRELDLLPYRGDFIDKNLGAAFERHVKDGKPMMFLTNSVVEKNDWVDGIMKYRIYMFGIIPDGSKACVILDNVPVHLDIMVPDGQKSNEFEDWLHCQLKDKNLNYNSIETVQMYKLHGFQKQKRPFKRVFFNNLQDRKKVIELVKSYNKARNANTRKLETAADDAGRDNYYFPKVAREHKFRTADWNRFENYTVSDAPHLLRRVTTDCKYTFTVDLPNFVKLSKDRRQALANNTNPFIQSIRNALDKDPTMVCMWDIETYRTIQNGLVPTPADTDYTIFMMCSAYFWHYEDTDMLNVCCVDKDENARKGVILTIVCETELNVLITDTEVKSRMAADIRGAFNGGNFDWPLTREKFRRYGKLVFLKSRLSSLPPIIRGKYADTEESVLKWNFKHESIKIDAETKHELDCVADFPGSIDTDALPVFLKLYTKMEVRKAASLNFFLAKNGLESKEDMPYKRMFKIYERAIKLANMKSCHCGTAQHQCATCKEHVRELDYVPVTGSKSLGETEYSDELHHDLVFHGGEAGTTPDNEGKTRCCYCGKKPRNASDMADVGYYCVIDCVRPQQLYVKRSIIPDKRELSSMSFVSLYDSFYRADGMKVRNVIGSYCHKYEIAFSNAKSDKTDSDKDHYPGAWVFPPERGLNNKRPITGLDFASLYPSLMMAFNLSPDMIVREPEYAAQLIAEGYNLYKIQPFDYEKGAKKGNVGNQQLTGEGWTVRHNGVFNPRKDAEITAKYTKYETYEYTAKEEVDGKTIDTPKKIKYAAKEFVYGQEQRLLEGSSTEQAALLTKLKQEGVKMTRKVSYEATKGRAAKIGERMGIFSYIVKKLFDKRVPIKAEFVRLSKFKEQMEVEGVKEKEMKNPNGTVETITMKEIIFRINKTETKQKAIKVLANTFYGESGNFKSSIYELLVAAGITTAGQQNIKKVAVFVTSKGFSVKYGDTDSLYITCPDAVYAAVDREYAETIAEIERKFAEGEYNGAEEYLLFVKDANEFCDRKIDAIHKVAEKSLKKAQSDTDREKIQIEEIKNTAKVEKERAELLRKYEDLNNSVNSIVEEARRKYRLQARIKYWTAMVDITMKVMTELKEQVSDFLLNDNGTCFLNMAYEEVGFPTVLCGKKKYFMTPHIETINFYPKDIFIRGIDIIKQGQAKLAKTLGDEFMREAISPENERDLIDIAVDKIRKCYAKKWEPEMFAQSAKYKPGKNNVPVHTFVARMRAMQQKYKGDPTPEGQRMYALYEPPEAGDKFEYVLVKKDLRYTLQGTKIDIKKGDQMEFLRVYRASHETPNPMEIDLDYYMEGSIIGLFARFIAYHADFQPPEGKFNILDKEEYKKMDQYCIDQATKYLQKICNEITGYDKVAVQQQGRDYRSIYNNADKQLRYDLMSRYGGAGYMIHHVEVHDDATGVNSGNEQTDNRARSTKVIEQFKNLAKSLAEAGAKGYGRRYMEFVDERRDRITPFRLRRIFNSDRDLSIGRVRLDICAKQEIKVVEDLYKIVPTLIRVIHKKEKGLINLIDDMRKIKTEDDIEIEDNELDRLNSLDAEERETVENSYKLLTRLIAIYKVRANTLDIISELEIEKNKTTDDVVAPAPAAVLARQDSMTANILRFRDEDVWQ